MFPRNLAASYQVTGVMITIYISMVSVLVLLSFSCIPIKMTFVGSYNLINLLLTEPCPFPLYYLSFLPIIRSSQQLRLTFYLHQVISRRV